MASSPVLDLAGQTDIGTFAALIRQLDLLVTNDTGASHVAAATQTPSVILFGPNRPYQWAPLNRALHRPVDAVELAGPGADPRQALAALPLEPVLAVCVEMLDSTNDQRLQTTENRPRTAGHRLLINEVGRRSSVVGRR
jgi:hypothetical protein